MFVLPVIIGLAVFYVSSQMIMSFAPRRDEEKPMSWIQQSVIIWAPLTVSMIIVQIYTIVLQ